MFIINPNLYYVLISERAMNVDIVINYYTHCT